MKICKGFPPMLSRRPHQRNQRLNRARRFAKPRMMVWKLTERHLLGHREVLVVTDKCEEAWAGRGLVVESPNGHEILRRKLCRFQEPDSTEIRP